ncbi:hypothetical protein Tco_1292278 [Tanacetum coccineum]
MRSTDEKNLLADVAETFENLKAINMKLNPKKCSFGVEEGKFLGYMVTSEGIRANLKKIKAISDLTSPKTLKEMQSLSGKLASLNRFLAKGSFSADEEADNIPPLINTVLSEGDTVCIPSSGKQGCLSSTADRSKRKTMPSLICEQNAK